jgi:hypothetical protein
MQIINVSPPLLLLTSIAAAMSQRAVGHATEQREEEKEVPFFNLKIRQMTTQVNAL